MCLRQTGRQQEQSFSVDAVAAGYCAREHKGGNHEIQEHIPKNRDTDGTDRLFSWSDNTGYSRDNVHKHL